MSDSGNDMGDWRPPNEAEMKVLEARRERNNQISRLMANYMLKGYRMLDRVCHECSTVLLQDRNNQEYCVACRELESETSKDDPATSAEAAAAAVLELQQRQNQSTEEPRVQLAKSETEDGQTEEDSASSTSMSQLSIKSRCGEDELSRALQVETDFASDGIKLITAYFRMKSKIDQLSKKLIECENLDETKDICNAIKVCAETAVAVKKLL